LEEGVLVVGQPPQRARTAVVEERGVRGLVDEEEVRIEARVHADVHRRFSVALRKEHGVGVRLVQPVRQLAPERGRGLAIGVVLDRE
jgi:hypothetical protein